MIAITTSSSISVKPPRRLRISGFSSLGPLAESGPLFWVRFSASPREAELNNQLLDPFYFSPDHFQIQ